eukprot:256323-Prymnesium_polylepis.1
MPAASLATRREQSTSPALHARMQKEGKTSSNKELAPFREAVGARPAVVRRRIGFGTSSVAYAYVLIDDGGRGVADCQHLYTHMMTSVVKLSGEPKAGTAFPTPPPNRQCNAAESAAKCLTPNVGKSHVWVVVLAM